MEKIIFRTTKYNRYSITPLVGAIFRYKVPVYVIEAKSVEDVLKYDNSIVAYSFMSFDLPEVLEELKKLKSSGRNFIFIVGGPHASADPGGLLQAGFDYVFTGDGEKNLIDFLNGAIPENRIFDGIQNRIDLDLFPPICEEKKLFMPLEITRGCPYACAYCETPVHAGRNVRHRSIDQIEYYEKIGVKHGKLTARFISPNSFGYGSPNGVTPAPKILDELLYRVKNTGVKDIYFGTFPSDVRPESVTDEVVKVVKKYVKNRYIVLGAQSGSNRILKIIRRGHTAEKIEESLEILANNGFYAKVDFIFGFPFEEEEDINQTFDFINKIVKKYKAQIHAHTFMPLPGTSLANVGAGKLKDYHYKFLGKLASEGILDGYWIKQEELAKKVENISGGR